MSIKQNISTLKKATRLAVLGLAFGMTVQVGTAFADETSCSPFTPLLKGQEDFVYVWTLGVKGIGNESDKLVTVDVNPDSSHYGKVINKISVGGRGEAHHMGFTDDRKFMWAGALDSNNIYIFDVATNPQKPRWIKTIRNFASATGLVGPHTFYATPGRMIVGALSNAEDHGGRTGMATYTNSGELVTTTMMPTNDGADGFGYDLAINPNKNVMLTTSFTGWNNYMMDLGKLIKDPEAMKQFGNTSVMWDYKSMKPIKQFKTPGAPLETRWSFADGDNWADDSPRCKELLVNTLLPTCQYYSYIEITRRSHQTLWHEYEKLESSFDNFAMKNIKTVDDIFPVFRELFAKEGQTS